MTETIGRTGFTSLTGVELYLLDALFDVKDRLGALNRGGFEARNLACPYDLDSAGWEAVARRLSRRGLLRFRRGSRRPDLGPWVSLTPAGGNLWESERAPDWSRFCDDSSAPTQPNDLWILRVRSADATVAAAFLGAAVACGLYAADLDRIDRREINARVVPWKPRVRLFELRVPLVEREDQPPRVVDWTLYESLRTWWRSITELITLR